MRHLAVAIIVCCCTFMQAGDQARDTTGNADKILGSWKLVKTPQPPLPKGAAVIVTFDKDGKLTLTTTIADKKDVQYGKYKVADNKLTVRLKGQEEETETIKTLNDKKLVTVNSKGKESEFARAKKQP